MLLALFLACDTTSLGLPGRSPDADTDVDADTGVEADADDTYPNAGARAA